MFIATHYSLSQVSLRRSHPAAAGAVLSENVMETIKEEEMVNQISSRGYVTSAGSAELANYFLQSFLSKLTDKRMGELPLRLNIIHFSPSSVENKWTKLQLHVSICITLQLYNDSAPCANYWHRFTETQNRRGKEK